MIVAYSREYQREWARKQRATNPEEARAKLKAWRLAHPEKVFAQQARSNERRRAKYAANPEPLRTRAEKWRNNNLEKSRSMAREYAANNREAAVVRAVQWQKDNPEKVAVRTATRRSREKGAGGSFSRTDWLARLQEFDRHCAYCLRRKHRLDVEHVIPLATGGSNSIDNIVPACKSCNARKGARGPLSMIGGW